MRCARSLLLCALALLTLSVRASIINVRSKWFRSIKRRYDEARLRSVSEENAHFFAGWYNQTLDHFNGQSHAVFQQRYWTNDEFFDGSGPVFLYIEGESAGSHWGVSAGHHYEMARARGALLVSLEHRFYGLSQPTGDLKTKSLQLLSSQQALEDLAQYVSFITDKFSLTSGNKWICFGGSYPGALSAWFRMRYPHLVVGAVASSAPLRVMADFSEYNFVVTDSISDPIVGGSEQCVARLRKAFEQVDAMLDSQMGRQTASTMFRSCASVQKDEDCVQFGSNLGGLFQGVVQYNSRPWPTGSPNISALCEILLNEVSYPQPIDALVAINDHMMRVEGEDCVDNSYANFLNEILANTTVVEHRMIRQWVYQTCAEFGYFQACAAGSKCALSRYMTLDSSFQMCSDAYGFPLDPEFYDKNAKMMNGRYGADHPFASNVIFPNGDIDPWHALSLLTSRPMNQIAVPVKGTSHCFDMDGSSSTFPLEMIGARGTIERTVDYFLQTAPITAPARRHAAHTPHAHKAQRRRSRRGAKRSYRH